jgi:hypothetical protein
MMTAEVASALGEAHMQLHERQRLAKLSAATMREIQRSCSQTASQMQCPVHRRTASVTVAGLDLASLEININGCCDEFVKQVRDVLKKGPLA